MVSKKRKINLKKVKKEIAKEIPDDIKIIFGKFFVFSLFYLFIFFIVYPLFLVKIISTISSILIFVLLILFYFYMIIDVIRKKNNFSSIGFVVMIPLVLVAISFSLVKFLGLA